MPEYVQLVKNNPAPRARDFLDIHDTVHRFKIDLTTAANKELLVRIFEAKRAPLVLIRQIEGHREFHRQDWPAVEATVRPDVKLEPFDYYFAFVVDIARRLEPLRNV